MDACIVDVLSHGSLNMVEARLLQIGVRHDEKADRRCFREKR